MPTAKGWTVADLERKAAPAGGAVVSDSDRGPATADGEPWKGV